MSSPTELADQLSLMVNHTKIDLKTPSEFGADDKQFLTNSINKFIANLNQYPNDHKLSCSDIVDGLNLMRHPEGGFYRRFSWTKDKSCTFYLLSTGCVSSWHRLMGTSETWKWIYGGTLIIPQISDDFRWLRDDELAKNKEVVIMGDGAEKWSSWFGAYQKDGEFSLVACECVPPFEFSKFELANEKVVNQFRAMNPSRVDVVQLLTTELMEKR